MQHLFSKKKEVTILTSFNCTSESKSFSSFELQPETELQRKEELEKQIKVTQ